MDASLESSEIVALAGNLDSLHSVALLNKLAKAKHERLHAEIVQIESLLKRAESERAARSEEYSKRFAHYDETIKFL